MAGSERIAVERAATQQTRSLRVLVLVSDAFGGRGGIAKFNRDLLTVLAAMPECAEVVVIPRLIPAPLEPIPSRIRFVTKAAGGKFRFVMTVLFEMFKGHFDLVVVGHINLAPIGFMAALMKATPTIMIIHGVDAWSRHKNRIVRMCLGSFDAVVGVSDLTLQRFAGWAGVEASRLRLLPNGVDMGRFTAGPKPVQLAKRLGLENRTVIMTLGRLESEERHKGFDEIIDTLPALAKKVPNISYLICGDGPDRDRLEARARALHVSDRVVFAGFVPEEEKADYYRLADAYVMPSRGEGFGIVILEALACGIPVMGSRDDGSREALLNGKLGCLVDPSNLVDVEKGVLETLQRKTEGVAEGLDYYSQKAFTQRTETIVREALAGNLA